MIDRYRLVPNYEHMEHWTPHVRWLFWVIIHLSYNEQLTENNIRIVIYHLTE